MPRVGRFSSWRAISRVDSGMITSLKVSGWSLAGNMRSPVILFVIDNAM